MKIFLSIFFILSSIFLFSKEKLPENTFFKLRKQYSDEYIYIKAKDALKKSNLSQKNTFDANEFLLVYHLNKNNIETATRYLNKLNPRTEAQKYLFNCRKAYYYYRLNKPFEEFNCYLKAKSIISKSKFYDHEFIINYNLSQFYLLYKNSEKVLETCHDFFKNISIIKDKYHYKKSEFYRFEAEAYMNLGKYKKSLAKIDSSLFYSIYNNDTTQIFLGKRLKSQIFLEKKDYNKAKEIVKELKSSIYNAKNVNFYQHNDLLNDYILGRIYFENNQNEIAKPYLKKVTYSVIEFPYHEIYHNSVKIYTEILNKENKHKEAYNLLFRMEEKKDSIYNSHEYNKILNKEIDYIQEKEEIHYELKELKWRWLIIGFLVLSTTLVFLYIFRLKNIENLKVKNRLIAKNNRELNTLNESLEKFAQITSHDLKAPIRSIGHLATFIQEDEPNLSEESKKNLEHIQSSVENSNNLILNMLALAKSNDKNISREKVNTWVIFRAVESNLLKMISDSNAKIIYNERLPIFITGNQSLLIQLFQNIIQNSIKYARKGVDPLVEISAVESGKSTIFYIKDNGVGIKEDKKGYLFNAFSQENFESLDKGVGLGLYITKKIADIHNAKITINSNDKNGTIVGIIFNKK
ncbi:methanoproteinis regulatory histidine kinase FilI [Flavobacteriaceae bacterium UJ101]|nr:methanoproteinis regulatory histidine kinase FilI [Flavobacteriaceae bacterium UJ101]